MEIFKNIPLKKYNTFGLDYQADCLIHLKTMEEAISVFRDKTILKKPLFIIGSGSNILFINNFNGTILFPEIEGIIIEEQNKKDVIVSAGAGVRWDNLVEWTVKNQYGGLENLSLIPGLVGATPVQNIGAYGVEVKDMIENVEAVNINDGSVRVFSNEECAFGYRNSIFKKEKKGMYMVTRVYFKLTVNPLPNLKYGSLKEEVARLGDDTLQNVRQAVINIRRNKLPDPEIIGNAGSFFKNPVVSISAAKRLTNKFPLMPVYKEETGCIKLAAGWLIDQCGWKGKRNGDAGVHDKQALVLVNHGNSTGIEILDLSEAIKKSVQDKFGVTLEREVEVVGTI